MSFCRKMGSVQGASWEGLRHSQVEGYNFLPTVHNLPKKTSGLSRTTLLKRRSVQGSSWEMPRPDRSGSFAFEPRPTKPKIRHRNRQCPSGAKLGRCRKPLGKRFGPTGSKARISCPRPTTSQADTGFEQDHPVEKGGRCEKPPGKDPRPTDQKDLLVSTQHTTTEKDTRFARPFVLKSRVKARCC